MNIRADNVLEMTRGDSETIKISCENYPFAAGDIITFTVRKNVSSPIVIQKQVREFDNGKAIIFIDPEDTAGLLFATYVYDIQLTTKEGDVKTIIKPPEYGGNFKVLKEVTY